MMLFNRASVKNNQNNGIMKTFRVGTKLYLIVFFIDSYVYDHIKEYFYSNDTQTSFNKGVSL